MTLGLILTDITSAATTTLTGIGPYINAMLGIGLGLMVLQRFRKA